jgi:homogentisate 1,2-dioxygenase
VSATVTESDGYMSGFGNEFATEALAGALPRGRNSPQRCPLGCTRSSSPARHSLRLELRIGARGCIAFVRQSRTEPSSDFAHRAASMTAGHDEGVSPNQLRWDPLAMPGEPCDFIEGLVPMAGNGSPEAHAGCAHLPVAANQSDATALFLRAPMANCSSCRSKARCVLDTELGRIRLEPQEIAVIPRGLRFRVDLSAGARAAISAKISARHSNCRTWDPSAPTGWPMRATSSRRARATRISMRRLRADREVCRPLMDREMDHSPLDVVAWHGNNVAVQIRSAPLQHHGIDSYDHPDPSIFLVLHSPSDTPGTSNIDFVVFPPRWLAMENTFRPPWFHRNVANEFMGLIHGVYDAKSTGFVPGGARCTTA